MSAPKPAWPAHDDDGVWYCDAHGTYDCRKCALGPSAPPAMRPFASEPIADILSDVPHGGMEDRSLGRDYLAVLAARVEVVLAILDRFRPPQSSGQYDAALLAEEIQRALDGVKP